MLEKKTGEKPIDTLRSEHLTNGERPIIASVEGYQKMTVKEIADGSNRFRIFTERDEENTDYAEYGGNTKSQEERGFLTGAGGNYVFSPVNAKGKVSTGYIMCTGVAVVGKDKEKDENISFLSHQFPVFFLPGKSHHKQFVGGLETRLEELKQRSVPGSIDAVIFGGKFYEAGSPYENEYTDSIQLLQDEIRNALGFDPVVITGPKRYKNDWEQGDEVVFFDTANRRLYISRPETGDATTESYRPDDVAAQTKRWRNKE
ncbi:MAG: hypothetical protein WC878_01940 [Candidatus Paceibacterota bacterium]|jgi:hypothetical protein